MDVSKRFVITGVREGVFSSDLEVLQHTPSMINSTSYKATQDIRNFASGKAGNINISVPTLIVDDSAIIGAGTGTDTAGGRIMIDANNITVSNGALINSSSGFERGGIVYIGTGQGGSIELKTKQLTVNNHGMITAHSLGTGDAGQIAIQADKITMRNQAKINTATEFASGGNITAPMQGVLQLNNAQITTSVGGGKGDGGNITLNPEFIVMDNGKIIARAVEGRGGNIDIRTTGIYRFPPESASPIDASSKFGISGEVDIDSPDVDISGSLIILSADVLDASGQIQPPCSVQLSKNKSSFIVKKLYGSPSSPMDWKSNILVLLPENDKQVSDSKNEISSTNLDTLKAIKIACAKNTL